MSCFLCLIGYYQEESLSDWSWSQQGRQVLCSVISQILLSQLVDLLFDCLWIGVRTNILLSKLAILPAAAHRPHPRRYAVLRLEFLWGYLMSWTRLGVHVKLFTPWQPQCRRSGGCWHRHTKVSPLSRLNRLD
jgi:hypothetical protein